MRSRNLLKFTFFLLFLVILFKFQNNSGLYWHAHKTTDGYYTIHFHSVATDTSNQNPQSKPPQNSKDIVRLELFALFLSLNNPITYSFSIFQFPAIKVEVKNINPSSIACISLSKNRAPPISFGC